MNLAPMLKIIVVGGFAVSFAQEEAIQAPKQPVPDYQAWYQNRLAYEKMQESLQGIVAETEDEEELLPASKKIIKQAVTALGSAAQGMLGAPTQKEIYGALFDAAVSRGQVSFMRFLVKECGVNPNAVVTLEKPNALHSLDVQKKYHLEGPYRVTQELFALGLKQHHINSWDAAGQTPLHKVINNMIIAGSNSTLTQEQFASAMAHQGITFATSSEAAEEYEGFLVLNKQRGEEWAAVAQLLIARGARNIKNAQGKKVEDILRESACKAAFCKKIADYLGQK